MMKKEFNEKKIHPLSTAINLFDFENKKIDLRGWFYDILRIFEEVELVPTLIEVVSENPDVEITRILVKTAIKRFEASNFEGLKGFLIYATPSSDVKNPFKWLMTVDIDLSLNQSMFSLDYDSELIPFDSERVAGLFNRMEGYCGAQYGYAVQRAFDIAGPAYAWGIGSDLPKHHRDPVIREEAIRESKLIGQWGNKYNDYSNNYQTGDLRQIYPYNLLSKEHLERSVGDGKTLEQCIKEPGHGALEKLSKGRWMWSVEKDNIPRLTKEIEGSGIILCL